MNTVEQPLPEFASAETIGSLVGLSSRHVRNLEGDGTIKKISRNRYPLVATVAAIVQHIRFSRTAADSSLKAARQREIEMRMAREDNRLIEVEEAIAVTREIVGLARNEFAGLPARVTSDIPLRRKIETEVNASFQRIKDRHTKRASALRRSGEAVDTDTED